MATDFPVELFRGFKAPYIITHGALCPPESPPHGPSPSKKGLISREFMKTCQLATSSPFIICTAISARRQEEKGTTDDEMVGWHHWLNGHGLSKLQEMKDKEAWHAAVHGVVKSWI